ncbi:hypothetical protein CesoFtcFv8_004575 [Champsocephalus esox]|uniref:Uncharacterized protein n=1 Tax=Champsocephalus esox TaxID=159716 RepID=A0AAN8CNF1_9TELE|nr:hypothetical protein CesoFtcFv8_004575 [Champsocephalus esox]
MISIVGESVDSQRCFQCLRLLSCQLWASLQSQGGEQDSCLCWTAVLLPACSLALVRGPVISVSGLSRQPTQTLPRHKGGLVLGETGVGNSPPPPSSRSPGRCLLRRSHIFEAEQLREKGLLCHPFTVATSQETLGPSS